MRTKMISRKLWHVLPVLLLFVFTSVVSAQNPTLSYAHKFGSRADHGEFARVLVKDSKGDVYVLGIFHDTVDFDPAIDKESKLISTGDDDIYIAKYKPTGALVWAKIVNTQTNPNVLTLQDIPVNMAIDEHDDIYVVGLSTTAGVFISKIHSEGQEIWRKVFSTDDVLMNDEKLGIRGIIASNNSVVLTGKYKGEIDFDPSESGVAKSKATSIFHDGFMVALSYSGDFLWMRGLQGNGLVEANAVSKDSKGDIVVAGVFTNSLDLDPDVINTDTRSSIGRIDRNLFVAKYSGTGKYIWGNASRDVDEDFSSEFIMSAVETDKEDRVVVLGILNGVVDLTPKDATATLLSSVENLGTVLVKYDSDGGLVWSSCIEGDDQNQNLGTSMDLDACGNIYIAGELIGDADFNPLGAALVLSSFDLEASDIFMAKYAGEHGDAIWATGIVGAGSPDFVELNAHLPLLVNDSEIYLAGTFKGTLDFDPSEKNYEMTSLTNSEQLFTADFFLAKYEDLSSSCGLNSLGADLTEHRTNWVYPNPVVDRLCVQAPEGDSYTVQEICVKDMLGNVVAVQKFSSSASVSLACSALNSGMYIVEIKTHKGLRQEKVTVR